MGSYGEALERITGSLPVGTPWPGGPPQVTLRLGDLPGWSFVLSTGRIAFVSGALAAWLGYETPAALVGAASQALLVGSPPQGRSQGRALLALLRRDGATAHVEMAELEVTLGSDPGTLFWAPGQGAELPGKPKRASRLTSVTAGLAHELNNPLTYLTLNLDFLERALSKLKQGGMSDREVYEVAEQGAEALQVAREGTDRLAAIVRDLRAFSRVREGVGPVDPRRLLELSFVLTRNSLRHKARLQLELHEVADVDANEAELGQIFVGLLLLVLQPIEDGSAAEHALEIRLEQPDAASVEVRITMTGPGAPKELASDPEFASMQARVASFGGELTADGTTTLLRLRVSGAEQVPRPTTSIPPPLRAGVRPRVLLVEDEPHVAEALRTLLSEEADVEHVTSGRQAIEALLRDQRYQLILCDLMMPDMGGVDVHEAVRRARPGVEQRIVFLTGGVFSQRTRDFLRSMPNRTLDKPVDPALLLALIRSFQPDL
ncbi:MAG: response regulator [Myxococcales bacterium]|nr:response regulator [Polyangiaceae bacterium]MDW8248098.1 response regulator [Myxococcales bacterium]